MPFLQVQKQVQIQVQNRKYDTFLQVFTKNQKTTINNKLKKIRKNTKKWLKISTKFPQQVQKQVQKQDKTEFLYL